MKRSLDIARILNHYGRENQVQKTCEELAELQVAITHDTPKEQIKSEIADVLIMCEQIKLMHGINETELAAEIDYKVDRQLERIANEK